MNNPSSNYPTCQKCGKTLHWVYSVDGGGSYCEMCSEALSRKSEVVAGEPETKVINYGGPTGWPEEGGC